MCVCEVAAKGAKKVKVIKENREDPGVLGGFQSMCIWYH